MTTNPLLILIINMTVVFFVLFVLELLTRGIYFIDPTRKKTAPAALAAVEAPAAVAMETVEEESGDDLAIVAVIAAALAAMGENGHVSVIRRIDGTSWTQMGRMDAVNTRAQMYCSVNQSSFQLLLSGRHINNYEKV